MSRLPSYRDRLASAADAASRITRNIRLHRKDWQHTVGLVRILSPESEPELATVVSMLEAHDIPCFVHNHGFGALFPGPQINSYNTRAIMVSEENVAAALELIQDFQSQPGDIPSDAKPAGRLRALIEFFLFGWFVPGSRKPIREQPRDPEAAKHD